MKTRSPLARIVPQPRDVTDRPRKRAWGACVHTTGVKLPRRAKRLGIPPMDLAIAVYLRPDRPPRHFPAFPHYVIDNEGIIVQIADEKERARHAGVSTRERRTYLSGRWKRKVSRTGLRLWKKRWPGFKSPQHLYPSRGPNSDYIGIEMIPLLKRRRNGSQFTRAQYKSLRLLLRDIECRHRISFARAGRLVGHEDLEPLTRWASYGGWDPGSLRAKPRFLWRAVGMPFP